MAEPRKEMTDEKLQGVVRSLLSDALDYRSEVGEMRESSTRAYEGDPYGNEKEGRSSFVTREVRDAVEIAKPILMRMILGSYRLLEYVPNSPDEKTFAEDATDYAYHVIHHENTGYIHILSAIEDALIRKTGVLKVWWEEDETPVKTVHRNLTEHDLQLLGAESDVTVVDAEPNGQFGPAIVPGPHATFEEQQQLQQLAEAGMLEPTPLYDAEVTRVKTKGRIAFTAVPAEELVIDRSARSFSDALLVGHFRQVTVSDLVAMGYDYDEVVELGRMSDDHDGDGEKEARSVGNTTDETEGEADPTHTKIDFAEIWVKVDYDGDGIAERRRICVAGSGYTILTNELADVVPMVDLCSSRIAHQAIGRSLAELVEDVQRLKTMTLRNVMDSLASAIHPDTEVVENQVNLDDVLNTEIGRIIRVKAPGMMQYKAMPFVGKEAFPVVQYLDTMTEARTGLNEAAEGLNADALQSTSTQAIQNAAASAASRMEFMARTMVETGLKGFFKLILRLAVENVDRDVWIRVNRRFRQINPASWNIDMSVDTTVALGSASMEQRLAVLRELAARMEGIIQEYGPQNPIAGPEEYRKVLAEIVRLSGIQDVDSYLRDATDPANQPPPPGPSPEQILAESEAERAKADTQRKQQELLLEMWKAMQQDDRERDRIMSDALLKAQKLKLEFNQADVNTIMEQVRVEVEREREQHQYVHNLLQDIMQARQLEQQQQMQQQMPPGGMPQ